MVNLKVRANESGETVVLANGMFGVRTMTLPIQFEDFVVRWERDKIEAGKAIQDVFPDLNKEQREFLISGATPEDWNRMFPKGGQIEQEIG